LKKSAPSRVVVLSSKLHYQGKIVWDDLHFERRKYAATAAYNQSKLANVLFANALSRRVERDGITVNSVHPGVVATELARDYPRFLVKISHLFLLTPAQGAESIREVVRSALDQRTLDENTPTQSSDLSRAVATAAVREGQTVLTVRARSRSLWWLCAAAALVAITCVGIARREQRSSAMAVTEVAWSL